MLHISEFVWTLRSSVFVVFNNFLLIDATARSKISSDQKRFFIPLSLYPLSFFANTPFNLLYFRGRGAAYKLGRIFFHRSNVPGHEKRRFFRPGLELECFLVQGREEGSYEAVKVGFSPSHP